MAAFPGGSWLHFGFRAGDPSKPRETDCLAEEKQRRVAAKNNEEVKKRPNPKTPLRTRARDKELRRAVGRATQELDRKKRTERLRRARVRS